MDSKWHPAARPLGVQPVALEQPQRGQVRLEPVSPPMARLSRVLGFWLEPSPSARSWQIARPRRAFSMRAAAQPPSLHVDGVCAARMHTRAATKRAVSSLRAPVPGASHPVCISVASSGATTKVPELASSSSALWLTISIVANTAAFNSSSHSRSSR